ncbi:MAG: Cu2+-exporting ATPase [Flavobacterium sp.]|jgi:Cu+-exporting ATPase
MKKVIGILAIGVLTLTVSCKDNKEHDHDHDAMQNEEMQMESHEDHDHSKMEETAATYYCPMKCEGDKTYDKAGECPKCGMDLVLVEKE